MPVHNLQRYLETSVPGSCVPVDLLKIAESVSSSSYDVSYGRHRGTWARATQRRSINVCGRRGGNMGGRGGGRMHPCSPMSEASGRFTSRGPGGGSKDASSWRGVHGGNFEESRIPHRILQRGHGRGRYSEEHFTNIPSAFPSSFDQLYHNPPEACSPGQEDGGGGPVDSRFDVFSQHSQYQPTGTSVPIEHQQTCFPQYYSPTYHQTSSSGGSFYHHPDYYPHPAGPDFYQYHQQHGHLPYHDSECTKQSDYPRAADQFYSGSRQGSGDVFEDRYYPCDNRYEMDSEQQQFYDDAGAPDYGSGYYSSYSSRESLDLQPFSLVLDAEGCLDRLYGGYYSGKANNFQGHC